MRRAHLIGAGGVGGGGVDDDDDDDDGDDDLICKVDDFRVDCCGSNGDKRVVREEDDIAGREVTVGVLKE